MQNKPQEIIVKSLSIEQNKDSLKLTYRKKRDGTIQCTGFELKVYGETAGIIDLKSKEIIKKAWDRFNEPYPKN